MKKIILLSIGILFSVSLLQAQITITNSDMPGVGDTVRFSKGFYNPATDYTLTGANYNWDFSGLTPLSQDIDTFVSVLSTPIFYYPSFILSANLAEKGSEFSMLQFTLTDVYDYFKKSSSSYQQIGFAASLMGIPMPSKYSSPDYIYRFPLSYGNVDSSEASLNQQVPFLGYYSTNIKRKNTVDGWGTVTTPYGTFNCLRLKSEVWRTDSVYLDSLGIGSPQINSYVVEYKWLANGFPRPILQITETNSIPTEVAYIDSVRNIGIGIAEDITGINELKVYPNPADEQLNISFISSSANGLTELVMLTLEGKEVIRQSINSNVGENNITLNVADLPKGVYLLRLQSATGSTCKKILIQ